MHHRGARTGRTDDEFRVALFAQLDEALGNSSCFFPISGIESRLATASLPLIEFDFAARAAQHFDGAGADAGPHLIDDAGDEQSDLDSIANCRLPIADCSHCQFTIADCRFEYESGAMLTGHSNM